MAGIIRVLKRLLLGRAGERPAGSEGDAPTFAEK
jgi:hypothetical protein